MKQIILLISIFFSTTLYSQNIESILAQVEENNTTLIALRKKADANRIGNKTGIFPENPEFEFHYLWGTPSLIGDRKDISIAQTFDFPTAYKFKNQISEISNEQEELEYLKEKKAILLETKQQLFDIIYMNALKTELEKRYGHAKIIEDSYSSRFESGDVNILEYNKAKINLLNAEKELQTINVERTASFSKLNGLNGGITVSFTDSVYPVAELPLSFEEWYELAEQDNPILNWLRLEVEKSKKQVQLQNALNLPKFKGGYMSEKVMDEQFQGILVGLSIPLWENKNKVKLFKASTDVLEAQSIDSKKRFYNHLETLYTKAKGLQKNLLDYRERLETLNHSDLLKTALDEGEITLVDYILELTIYYESINKVLESERDMNKTVALLYQYL